MIQVAYSDTTPGVAQTYDAFGRSLGYTYAKDGSVQQTVGTSYDAASGRIATASFLHGGATKTFSYNYLAGTPLLASLACPSNLTIEHAYEAGRDLVAGITIRRGAGTNVVLRNYTYDTLARPLTRSTSRNGTTQNDTFGYNSRSELVSATLGNDNYSYGFDAIGNRETSSEAGTALAYAANNLNQYTEIASSESSASFAFNPTYDADGNATMIQTSTGTWTIAYNGENRPIRFENAGTQTVVECAYDSQGRRFEKKVTVAGTTTLHHRYIYRGYLQIAALDLTRAAHPALWLVTWDPSQPTATRLLAIQKDGTWFTYGYDITKNVCELFGPNGYIRTAYSYAPFGAVTESGDVSQPFQWSSEVYDSELDLVYYNYRHYSPSLGRFLSRDPIEEQGGWNLYAFVGNNLRENDLFGLISITGAGQFSWSVPTPFAGVFLRVTVAVEISKFNCCENGRKVEMLSLGGSVTGEVVTGTAYRNKIRVKNPRGSRCRDRKTGRFVKCPKEGLGASLVVGDFIKDDKICPKSTFFFKASVVGSFSVGVGVGGFTGGFEFPIYPDVELPDLSGGYQWGVVGGEITLGVKGTFWAVLYEGESISI